MKPGDGKKPTQDSAILGAVFGMAGAIFFVALSIWIYKRRRSKSAGRIDPLLIESGNAYMVPPRLATVPEASSQLTLPYEPPSGLRPSVRGRIPQELSPNTRESMTGSSLTHVSQMSSFVRFFTSTPKSQSSASSGRRRRSFIREYASGKLPDTPTSPEKYNFSQIQSPQPPPAPSRRYVVMNPSSRSGTTTSSGTRSVRSKASQLKSFFFNTHPSTSAARFPRFPSENLQAQIPHSRPRLVVMNPSSSHSSATSRSARSRFSMRRKKRSAMPKAAKGNPPGRSRSLPIPPPLRIDPRVRASDPMGSSTRWRTTRQSSVLGPRPNPKRNNVLLKHV